LDILINNEIKRCLDKTGIKDTVSVVCMDINSVRRYGKERLSR
jgi:hypothetical protein